MMQIDGEMHSVLRRHAAFWLCGEVEKPLVGISRWPYITLQDFDWGLPTPEGTLHPDMLEVNHFLPQYEALYNAKGVLDGDLFWTTMPLRALPWLEGIMGCPIRYSIPNGSIFTEPIISDWGRLPQPVHLPSNPWFKKLVEFIQGLARLSAGRFQVAVPLTRGPWDLVGALRGMANVYLDIYDHPVELARLAEICADVWVNVTKRLAEVIPAWHGGYVGIFGVWAPEFTPTPQNDLSVSISPKVYRELMLPADRRTVQAWDCALFHLHSAGSQIADCVEAILVGRALNITIDPSGPALGRLLPVFRKVQARRIPLHLMSFDWDQVEELTAALSPRGIAITYQPVASSTMS